MHYHDAPALSGEPSLPPESNHHTGALTMSDKADRRIIEEAEHTLYEQGSKIRQEVFGPAHIAQSAALPDFMQPVQSMAVTAGWSLCWSRDGLDRRTRSLLCIVMLAVLGRDHELSVHVRGAISNGCTTHEIQEALLQVSVYAGVPASLNATKIAWEVLQEAETNGKKA